jgi:hypothetical protein
MALMEVQVGTVDAGAEEELVAMAQVVPFQYIHLTPIPE